MELCCAPIFEMRRVKLLVNRNGIETSDIFNVYKCIDFDLGIIGSSGNIEYFVPFYKNNKENYFPLITENNKYLLKEEFNVPGFYASGSVNFNLYRICNEEKFDMKRIKSRLNEFFPGYYIFSNNNLELINREENVEKLDEIFGDVNKLSKNVLKEYGSFLTEKEYLNNPAIGRDEEIKKLEIALLSIDKSGILIGESGVGKTAIVEGLAYKIKNGLVPEKLKNVDIVSISSSSLISGCQYVGMVEERVNKVINELKKNKNIVMFIDEIHTIIGAGAGSKSNLDVANILKPYLDRGDIKIIGSTTKSEYDNLMDDPAFKRRFKKINIEEPKKEDIIEIMNGTISGLEKYYNINFNFDFNERSLIYGVLLKLTDIKCRDQFDRVNNPDLILSILKDAFSIAALYENSEITLENIIEAINMCDKIYPACREKFVFLLRKEFNNKDEDLDIPNRGKILVFNNNNLN